jgi:hypothetical protein
MLVLAPLAGKRSKGAFGHHPGARFDLRQAAAEVAQRLDGNAEGVVLGSGREREGVTLRCTAYQVS